MEVELSGEQKELAEKIRAAVTPIAKRFLKQISLYTNNKYQDGARMMCAVACCILERALVSTALQLYKDDEEAGAKFIENVYMQGAKDALWQWRNL